MKKSLALISILTITCLYGILAAFVILITYLSGGSVLQAVLISIIVLVLQFLISPWLTDLSMKWFYKADFSRPIPEYLDEFINQVCEEYGMKHPKVGFINDGAPNAFTYGRFRNDARIIITRGVMELLDEEEVKGVVGHELGHVVHRDMLVMTAAQVVPLVLYAIYEVCMESAKEKKPSKSNGKDSNGGIALIGLIAYVFYLICQLIILWLSRTREYYADEFSCRETKNPWSLASALVTIGYGLATTGKTQTNNKHSVASPSTLGISDGKSSKEMAICCASGSTGATRTDIQNAMKWDMWNVWAKLYELLSTHPLISKRLLAISDICPEFGQERYITFDLEKPESYADDFLKEVFINAMPLLGFIVTFILAVTVFSTKPQYFILMLGLSFGLWLLKFLYKHPVRDIETPRTVKDLLGEVKVSAITPIPCQVSGTIIGRGIPDVYSTRILL
jgi:Zn-dependent protease with chaperone function